MTTPSTTVEDLSLVSADGLALHALRSLPRSPRGVLFLCHGLGEHAGRYDEVVAAVADAGWASYALDLRGHGRSEGRRGHIMAWADYVADVEALFEKARADGHEQRPWVLLGHSMGGLVSLHTAAQHSSRLAGLALCSPLLGVSARIPRWKSMLGRFLSQRLPAMALASELAPEGISSDPDEVERYRNDPLVHNRVSARWFTEMTDALAAAPSLGAELSLPLLLMHGSADPLTDPEATRRFAETYGGNLDLHLLDGYLHEIFHEVRRDVPLQLLTGWLARLVRTT